MLLRIGSMGARRSFSRGGLIRGLGTKVTQPGPGMEPEMPPEADDML